MLKGQLTQVKAKLSTGNCRTIEDTAHIRIRGYPKEQIMKKEGDNHKVRLYWLKPSTGRCVKC
jgi:hypothetical protein